jgi:hypothetical protein
MVINSILKYIHRSTGNDPNSIIIQEAKRMEKKMRAPSPIKKNIFRIG